MAAGEYQNWAGAAHSLTCDSRATKDVVKTVKTTYGSTSDGFEYVKNFTITVPQMIDGKEYLRKSVITSVKVDVLSDEDMANNVAQRPIVVEGHHQLHKNDKIKVELDLTNSNDNSMAPAKLFIKGESQAHDDLICNVLFAG